MPLVVANTASSISRTWDVVLRHSRDELKDSVDHVRPLAPAGNPALVDALERDVCPKGNRRSITLQTPAPPDRGASVI